MSGGEGRSLDLAIVGGGAAGLAAAAFAAAMRPEWRIRLLGGARPLGAKLLLAGGGRCNLAHRTVSERDYSGAPGLAVRRVLRAFPVERTLAFFREIGISVREEPDGRLFPASGRARDVRDALLAMVQGRRVEIDAASRVTRLRRHAPGFELSTTGGVPCRALRVLLATGGRSYPATGSDGSGYALAEALGHSLVAPAPALVPLVLHGDLHRTLSGVSHAAEVRLAAPGHRPLRLRGALLWTHFGVSGPVILDVSRHWLCAHAEGRNASLSVSLLPGEDPASLERQLLSIAAARPRQSLAGTLGERLPRSVGQALLAMLDLPGAEPLSQLRRADRRRLVQALTDLPLDVQGSRGFDVAEVTAGGVPLQEVDCARLASRCCGGLFFAGEMLDVDGRVGGFNLQWAWSSAFVAAHGATQSAVI